ncbi:MAG TPA: serine hydrolase domain-containing protein [Pilimelia sp.]|nr:serine hydrolase domain-containing protein [Pilimelia sp.]
MSLPRRSVLGAGVAAAVASLTGCGQRTKASWVVPGAGAGTPAPGGATTAPTGRPNTGAAAPRPTPTPAGTRVAAADAPYAGAVTAALTRRLRPTPENPRHPGYAGAVALVSVQGKITVHAAVGDALRYGAGPVELPPGRRVAMRPDSVFDVASITKVYTALLVLRLVDQGKIDLAAPVGGLLPGFTGAGKAAITVRMLLSHTSGLPVGAKVAGVSGRAARWAAVLATPLAKGARPGAAFRYSSVGYMVLGRLVERVTGQPLDRALSTLLTGPMGLRETGYAPSAWLNGTARAARLVATDARSSRGLLRGVVHDDVANQVGGVAGHAGVFATARDVAAVGEMLLGDGSYRGRRILSAATVRLLRTNANQGLPAIDAERPGRPSDHGLGVVLRQPWFMGRLSSPATFGHTGFTGTSLLVDPRRDLVLVLLTNRAHPNWSWANPDPVRVAIANILADALP